MNWRLQKKTPSSHEATPTDVDLTVRSWFCGLKMKKINVFGTDQPEVILTGYGPSF